MSNGDGFKHSKQQRKLSEVIEMTGTLCRIAVVFILSFSTAGPVDAAAEQPEDIGGRRELFVDKHLVDVVKGDVELRLNKPVAHEVVMIHDKPWEGNTCGYHTIFKDGHLYRMYYRGWGHDDKTQRQLHPAVVCYAESRDGIHWSRPSLGLVVFNGSKDNNIILEGLGSHNFTPFKDTNPDCPPQARYKAVARGEGDDNKKLFAFQSADAIV